MTMATAAVPQAEAPQGPMYIDTQHDDMVHDAQMDYYGCKLATSSSGTYFAAKEFTLKMPTMHPIPPYLIFPLHIRSHSEDLQREWERIRTHSNLARP